MVDSYNRFVQKILYVFRLFCRKSLRATRVTSNWIDAFTNGCALCKMLCGSYHDRYCYERS